MGKRKGRVDKNKAPCHPGIISHASQVDPHSKQMDAPGSSVKRSPGYDQNRGSSHIISLRQSSHPFGRHYSRRSSTNYSDASPSNWKASPLYDTKLSFKPENKDLQVFPYRGSRMFQEPERIRSISIGENSVCGDVRKMECGICEKRLRKSPFDSSSSSTDLCVVAVLVCGHVYHAECLEQKTSNEDRQDPPCPVCVDHHTLSM